MRRKLLQISSILFSILSLNLLAMEPLVSEKKGMGSLEIGGDVDTEFLVGENKIKISVPSRKALLDPSKPWGLNLDLVKQRHLILDRAGYYLHKTGEEVSINITNLQKSKTVFKDPLSKAQPIINYLKQFLPVTIGNKLPQIQNAHTYTELSKYYREIQLTLDQCKIKLEELQQLNMEGIEKSLSETKAKILLEIGKGKIPGDANLGITEAELNNLPD